MLSCSPEEMIFENGRACRVNTDQSVSLAEISVKDQIANDIAAVATVSHSSPVSPPPYMVGMVEIELDRYTGEVKILDYVAVVDCGIPINPHWHVFRQKAASYRESGIHCLRMSPTMKEDVRLNPVSCSIRFQPALIWDIFR